MAAILFRGLSAVIVYGATRGRWDFLVVRLHPLFGNGENPFNFVVVPVLLSMVGVHR